jgi:flagellar L-ring protein precursor FlgH
MIRATLLAAAAALAVTAPSAGADNLYRNSGWPAMTSDRRASAAGDALTVVILQSADASSTAHTSSSRNTQVGGSIGAGSLNERAELGFGGGYRGGGEVRRSERLAAQLTVTVEQVLPNGDLLVGGQQWLQVNGERTRISVRGRVRTADITSDNRILSTRLADAEIDYDGRGFVSRSGRPGLITRIFNFLGLI